MASEQLNLAAQLEAIYNNFILNPKDKVSPVCDYVRHVNKNVSPQGLSLFHYKIKGYVFCLDYVVEPEYNLPSLPDYHYHDREEA